jgi:naphthalene 1,2-dioxygenase system ferredoxin subunit
MSTQWIDAVAESELWADAGISVMAEGRDVAIFRSGDAVYASANLCTHGQARLCDGYLDGHEIECPLHQGRFDLRSGAPTCAPASAPLKIYRARIDGGRVYLALD